MTWKILDGHYTVPKVPGENTEVCEQAALVVEPVSLLSGSTQKLLYITFKGKFRVIMHTVKI